RLLLTGRPRYEALHANVATAKQAPGEVERLIHTGFGPSGVLCLKDQAHFLIVAFCELVRFQRSRQVGVHKTVVEVWRHAGHIPLPAEIKLPSRVCQGFVNTFQKCPVGAEQSHEEGGVLEKEAIAHHGSEQASVHMGNAVGLARELSAAGSLEVDGDGPGAVGTYPHLQAGEFSQRGPPACRCRILLARLAKRSTDKADDTRLRRLRARVALGEAARRSP